MKAFLRVLAVLFFLFQTANAKHLYPEKYYQNEWCSKWHGRQEVKLIDDTRIDCETKNYVVEFDFAPKWAESIGQSLHYARMTGKKPAIILIIENFESFKYYNRIKPLCEQYGIALWYMKSPQYDPSKNGSYNKQNDDYFDIVNIIIAYLKDFIVSFINGIIA